METLNQCHCCLQRPSFKDLKTPYTCLGITEIYSVMIEECFAIDLTLGNDDKCGICKMCVSRLRDACHFKMQVQRSQTALQERLQREQLETNRVEDAGLIIKSDTEELDASNDEGCMSPPANDATEIEPSQPASAHVQEQLAMTCSVRLEGLCSTNQLPHSLRTEQAYICDTCGQQFNLKSSIAKHVKKHMPKRAKRRGLPAKKFSCEMCPQKFTKYFDFCRHKKTHPSICDVCNKVFADNNNLRIHKRIHTGEKPFACKYCDRRFTQLTTLKVHTIVHTGLRAYKCKICNKDFTRGWFLRRHHQLAHTEEKPFSCQECDKRFKSLDYLKSHKITHLKVKPYPCDMCDKRFSSLDYLKSHKITHLKVKPYPCDICDMRFKRNKSLKMHKNFAHTKDGENNRCISCKVCNQKCRSRTDLRNHEMIHTGEKPYVCNYCLKPFISKYNLIRHVRTHTGEKPYSCKTCSKKFSDLAKLKYHEQCHLIKTSYVICDFCNGRYLNKMTLIRHMKLHLGPFDYCCKLCPKKFASSRHLRAHQTMHTAENSTLL